jgi:hypothetical protein
MFHCSWFIPLCILTGLSQFFIKRFLEFIEVELKGRLIAVGCPHETHPNLAIFFVQDNPHATMGDKKRNQASYYEEGTPYPHDPDPRIFGGLKTGIVALVKILE